MAVSHIARSKNASVAISAARRISCGRTRARIRAARGEQRCMQLGMVGLGRMGANMVRRLMGGGHECVVYDRSPEAVQALVEEGATGAESLADLVAKLAAPRHVWVMVPAGAPTEATVTGARRAAVRGRHHHRRRQLVLQGRRAPRRRRSRQKGIHYVDVGTSGGVWGLERGYCLMIGGPNDAVAAARPDLRDAGARAAATIAPHARAARSRTARPRTATSTAARRAPGTS